MRTPRTPPAYGLVMRPQRSKQDCLQIEFSFTGSYRKACACVSYIKGAFVQFVTVNT